MTESTSNAPAPPVIQAGLLTPRHQQIDVIIILGSDSLALMTLGPMEVFQTANTLWRRVHGHAAAPRFRVRAASPDGRPVRTPHAYPLLADCAIEDVDAADVVIVPGTASGWQQPPAPLGQLLPRLRLWHQQGAYIVGVGNGVAVLAESGLLDHQEAPAHWAVTPLLLQRYPHVSWRTDYAATEHARLLCGAGAHAATDLALYMVEKLCGRELAAQCARALALGMPDGLYLGAAVRPLARAHADGAIRETEDYLRRHLHRDISAEFLAERLGMGARSFIRRFKVATGHAPGAYMQLLRVAAAKELLENSSTPVSLVSVKIGYSDQAFFRQLFKRHTGRTPSAYREEFGKASAARGQHAGAAPGACHDPPLQLSVSASGNPDNDGR